MISMPAPCAARRAARFCVLILNCGSSRVPSMSRASSRMGCRFTLVHNTVFTAGRMKTRNHLLLSTERALSRIAGPRIGPGIFEFLVFGVKQAAACVFAGSFLFLLAISGHISVRGLARYDFLFLSAIAIQLVLVALRLENWREVAVLSLFHLLGMGLELFKTSYSVRSWSYPEPAFFHVRTVPLYSGFMYASVASYIMQAWRRFDLRLTHFPNFKLAVGVSVAIYTNFFTNHYTLDVRWPLAAGVLLLFWRARVHFPGGCI